MTKASYSSSAYTPDQLVAGEHPIVSKAITLLSGENRARGAVLGEQTASTVPATGTADGGNTGDGTVTSVAAGGADIKAGTYTLVCIATATDGGTFDVLAPDGQSIGQAVVGQAFTSSHLDLTVNDGATDFVLADKFTIAVTGSGKYLLSAAAATDGSAVPRAILAEDTDASAADVATVAYVEGGFDENEVTLGAGHTVDSIREGLREKGITLLPATKVE